MKRLALSCVASALLAAPAASAAPAARLASYCSPSGDVCYGAFNRGGRLILQITTAARYFTRYTLCVTRLPRGAGAANAQRCGPLSAFPGQRLDLELVRELRAPVHRAARREAGTRALSRDLETGLFDVQRARTTPQRPRPAARPVAVRPLARLTTSAYELGARSCSSWRSSIRRILPVKVFGRSSTNSICRG
jgi:hypothetical protein